ncbi:MAG: hypothetical protein J6M07_00675, partial [Ruminococcus sp.]|nr:hypothetical protein [Ruminococcus sp.]
MSGFKRLLSACGALLIMTSLAGSVHATESYDPYSYDRWGDAVSSQVGYSAEKFVDGKLINGLYDKISGMSGFDYDDESWKQLLQLKEPADLFISYDDK